MSVFVHNRIVIDLLERIKTELFFLKKSEMRPSEQQHFFKEKYNQFQSPSVWGVKIKTQ